MSNDRTFQDTFILEEFISNDYTGNKYAISKSGNLNKISLSKPYKSIKEIFKQVFLPEGYPASVSEDYATYQIWDTIQAFCSSISGALAAAAIFETIGVGDDKATIYGATFTWLIKDGTGMVGRIAFAWYQGTSLDSNSKMWRLYADILNDLSFFVDLTSPYFPRQFSIYFVSFSGLIRSIVGVAGGATRSSLTQHQAIKNNMADVSAKDGSQETLVNLVALVFNLAVLNYVKEDKTLVWILFILFVIGHIFSNYKAVKSVVMNTFNQNRFYIVAQNYLKFGESFVLEPSVVNKKEPVLKTTKKYCSITIGNSLKHIKSLTFNQLNDLLKDRFCLIITKRKLNLNIKRSQPSLITSNSDASINIILNTNCTSDDLVRALFQTQIIEYAYNSKISDNEFKNLIGLVKSDNFKAIEEESKLLAGIKFEKFLDKCRSSSWSFSYTQFSPGSYRYGHLKSL